MVTQATDEYKESPMLATVARACALDKAVLAALCRHVKSTGATDVSVDLLWDRLQDLLEALRDDPANTLQLPPVRVFHEALGRLADQGLLVRKAPRGGLTGLAPPAADVLAMKRSVFSLRPMMTDVVAAMKDHPIGKQLERI
jgi:hypothetical protein